MTAEERAGIWDIVDEALARKGYPEFDLLPWDKFVAVADAVNGLLQTLEEVEG